MNDKYNTPSCEVPRRTLHDITGEIYTMVNEIKEKEKKINDSLFGTCEADEVRKNDVTTDNLCDALEYISDKLADISVSLSETLGRL